MLVIKDTSGGKKSGDHQGGRIDLSHSEREEFQGGDENGGGQKLSPAKPRRGRWVDRKVLKF